MQQLEFCLSKCTYTYKMMLNYFCIALTIRIGSLHAGSVLGIRRVK